MNPAIQVFPLIHLRHQLCSKPSLHEAGGEACWTRPHTLMHFFPEKRHYWGLTEAVPNHSIGLQRPETIWPLWLQILINPISFPFTPVIWKGGDFFDVFSTIETAYRVSSTLKHVFFFFFAARTDWGTGGDQASSECKMMSMCVHVCIFLRWGVMLKKS